MVRECKNFHSMWHLHGENTSLQIQKYIAGRSLIILFLLSSLCHLRLCLKSQMSERKTKWERKGFGKISSSSSNITATRWRPEPLHHPLANSPAFLDGSFSFQSPVHYEVKFKAKTSHLNASG